MSEISETVWKQTEWTPEKIIDLLGQKAELRAQSAELNVRIESAERERDELKNKHDSLAVEVVHLREKTGELDRIIENAQLYLGVLETELVNLRAHIAALEAKQVWFSELSNPAPMGQMHYARVAAWKRPEGWFTVAGHPLTPSDWQPLPPTAMLTPQEAPAP